jgi:hypothetical protein
MNAILTKVFLSEGRRLGAGYRYGMLFFMIALTLFSAVVFFYLPPDKRGRYFGVIIPPTMLLTHVAYQFRWSVPVTVGLRLAAWVGCGVMMWYVLMWVLGRG